MRKGDTTFALDVVCERYLSHGTENLRSPEFTELMELCKDRAYDANVDGERRENVDRARPSREALAPRVAFTMDTTKDAGKGKAKAEASVTDDKAE
eukprot:jgi/Tetstr1/463554/TSEL_008433.t1